MRSVALDYELLTVPDISSALDLLADGEQWRPMAGGTDLMVLFNAGKLPWKRLVSIRDIPELRTIKLPSDHLEIGAAVTYSQIRNNPLIQANFPNLCAAASWTGGVSNQNRGTLGGNIVNASPAGDSLPALLTYDAELELQRRGGSRSISYRDFHTGYKLTRMTPMEMLVRIHLPLRGGGWQHYSRKVGTRRAQSISKLCLAASAKLQGFIVDDIRLAMGSVAPFPLRCFSAENVLRGERVNDVTIAAACKALSAEISPISDLRSTAAYRSSVAANLLAEFLSTLR